MTGRTCAGPGPRDPSPSSARCPRTRAPAGPRHSPTPWSGRSRPCRSRTSQPARARSQRSRLVRAATLRAPVARLRRRQGESLALGWRADIVFTHPPDVPDSFTHQLDPGLELRVFDDARRADIELGEVLDELLRRNPDREVLERPTENDR